MRIKSLKFLSPEGDGGGSAAVAEPPPAAAPAPASNEAEPLPSIGESYTAALEAAKGKEAAEKAPVASTTPASNEAAPVKESTATPPETQTLAPSPTAIDAAIEAQPVTEPASNEAATEAEPKSVLSDVPEVLPKDSRKEHWEKARNLIKTIEGSLHAEQKKTAELTKKLETSTTTSPEIQSRLEALEKQNQEYKEALVALDVQFDPDHRKKFVDGRVALVGKAASKLNSFGGNGEKLVEAMKMEEGRARNQAIKEAMVDLEDVEKARVMSIITEVEKLDDEKAEIMKDPQSAWQKLQEGEKARVAAATEQREKVKNQIFERVANALPKDLLLLREVDPALPGATEHNARAKTIRDAARKLLDPNANPEHLIEAAFWREAGPATQRILLQTRVQLREALKKLGEYDGASPGFNGGKPPDKSELDQKLEKSPGTIYEEFLKKKRQTA